MTPEEFESEEELILSDLENLDKHSVEVTTKLLKNLRTRILALTEPSMPGMMLAYYSSILEKLNGEIDIFEKYIIADLMNQFDKYWDNGISIGKLVAKAEGLPYFDPSTGGVGLDKATVSAYIVSVARDTSGRIRGKLEKTLQRVMLSGGNAQDAVAEMATYLLEEKTSRTFVQGVSSEMVVIAEEAKHRYLDELEKVAPGVQQKLTKTWVWSQVSRKNHALIDGKTISYKEMFNVPGWGSVPAAEMFGPHDFSAPIGQTAFCKCVLKIGYKGE